MATTISEIEQFLQPLHVDTPKIHSLARAFATTFERLAAESLEQFLPTPISDSVLRPEGDEKGRYLAIDIGGTNLRVGFIELLGLPDASTKCIASSKKGEENGRSRVQRQLEKSWPIGELLKQNKAEDLFRWIGECVAEVVQDGCQSWPGLLPDPLPMGVTFSFPMVQHTLSDATLMGMGKGFAMQSNLDLAKILMAGYERSRSPSLPRIKITAICNDTVATLVSFAYQRRRDPKRKAAMGLIVGTGCNATIPLALSKLHPSKRPKSIKVLDDHEAGQDLKITVNTEWTIKGAAGPLHDLNFITKWDSTLDAEGEAPGFQPFEYMTAGRYLGELGRLIILDYFTTHLHIPRASLPPKLLRRHGLTTTFLGNIGPHLSASEPSIVKQLESELSASLQPDAWHWTDSAADIVLKIAKAVQRRAAGMTAAAVIGLLACADEIHLNSSSSTTIPNGVSKQASHPIVEELMVGYTGGCIVHFQDYLDDCQGFLDSILEKEARGSSVPRVVLLPCHDGGILGAGILAGTVHNVSHDAR